MKKRRQPLSWRNKPAPGLNRQLNSSNQDERFYRHNYARIILATLNELLQIEQQKLKNNYCPEHGRGWGLYGPTMSPVKTNYSISFMNDPKRFNPRLLLKPKLIQDHYCNDSWQFWWLFSSVNFFRSPKSNAQLRTCI